MTTSWEDLKKEMDEWEQNRPAIAKWLDNKFPNGIAEYRPSHALTHPWLIAGHMRREVVWAWQRVFRGWDDRVIWSIDHYLADKIPQWMMTLRKTKAGYPVEMYEEGEANELNNYNPGVDASNRAEEKWNDILFQIALGFECYKLIDEESLYQGKPGYDELIEKYNTGFELLHKWFGALWD